MYFNEEEQKKYDESVAALKSGEVTTEQLKDLLPVMCTDDWIETVVNVCNEYRRQIQEKENEIKRIKIRFAEIMLEGK